MSRKENRKRWRENNPEYNSLYYQSHKEECKKANEKWRASNPDKIRVLNKKSSLRNRYGLTIEDYEALLNKQGNVCAICSNPQSVSNRSLYVDHCHATNRVRGLLCHECNCGLGKFRDSSLLLQAAIDYVRCHA